MRQYIRGILYSYPLGTKINDGDTKFLLDVLRNHPEADIKIGCGIKAFEVRQNPRFTTNRCFYLIRADGTEDDFSISKCLSASSPLRVFKSICRNLIGQQMYDFKSNYFERYANDDGYIQCPITRELTAQSYAHVDHIPPDTFEKLVTDFIAQNNIDVEEVELKEDKVGKTFVDEKLVNQWIEYHNKNAKLRVVSAKANLSIIRKSKFEEDNSHQTTINQDQPEKYVTIMKAALQSGVSDKTIQRAIKSGKLPARYPHPNKAEISIADLEVWKSSTYIRPGENQDRMKSLEDQLNDLSESYRDLDESYTEKLADLEWMENRIRQDANSIIMLKHQLKKFVEFGDD